MVQTVKNPPANAGDPGSIPGSGKSLWRKKWQPTSIFLPGKCHGQRSLAGYSPLGCKESDTTNGVTHEGLKPRLPSELDSLLPKLSWEPCPALLSSGEENSLLSSLGKNSAPSKWCKRVSSVWEGRWRDSCFLWTWEEVVLEGSRPTHNLVWFCYTPA